ncbi:MAG: hypothetical protein JXN63_04195 [Candidatus Delongbacteria bacterium]|nr:hypothetical protein [Candidatus Delongbacteria bacterium]
MELEVIRHKTAELFFTGFFPEDVAASYSYQLQRMFESGAAREGDYFVVRKNAKPYLNVEIFRNNTRRIWEKPPSFALGIIPEDENETGQALELIFDFLDDPVYYFKAEDRLEIVISDDWKAYGTVRDIIPAHGYKKFGQFEDYELKLSESTDEHSTSLNFEPFTDLEPESRFNLVYENDQAVEFFDNINPGKLYQDYIEEGYDSEPLWKFFTEKESPAGFIMPVFTSGLKNELRLLNYSYTDRNDFAAAAVSEMIRIAKENNIKKCTFAVKSDDRKFVSVLKETGAVKTNSFERYAKK